MFSRNKEKLSSRSNVACFVDGPNIIRKEFNLDLDELRRTAQKYGRIIVGKVFLNQHASDKLIEAIANQGFEPTVMLSGETDPDVDVALAVAVVEAAYNSDIDIIVIGSRDADYLPAIQAAKKRNKKVVVMGTEPGFSKALQHSADYVEFLRGRSSPPKRSFN
ncbi:MAG: NYN domain-containing protein [Nanoarchaeota archaeon]